MVAARGGRRLGRTGCSVAAGGVDADGAGAGGGEVEKDEAEQDGGVAAVQGGKEALWKMRHEVGDGHVAGEQEGHRAGEQAEDDQQAAGDLQAALDTEQREQFGGCGGGAGGEGEEFLGAVLQELQAGDDAQQAEEVGRRCSQHCAVLVWLPLGRLFGGEGDCGGFGAHPDGGIVIDGAAPGRAGVVAGEGVDAYAAFEALAGPDAFFGDQHAWLLTGGDFHVQDDLAARVAEADFGAVGEALFRRVVGVDQDGGASFAFAAGWCFGE